MTLLARVRRWFERRRAYHDVGVLVDQLGALASEQPAPRITVDKDGNRC